MQKDMSKSFSKMEASPPDKEAFFMKRRRSTVNHQQKTQVIVTEPCTRVGTPMCQSPNNSGRNSGLLSPMSQKSPNTSVRNQKSILEKLLKA